GDIRLIEKLLYDNSSPRPSKEFVSANSDAKIESFSSSPILVKDSDSLMEEIDLFCTPDYTMPPCIEDDDYDSKKDILILKDLPSNNTLSFAEKESFHFDIPPFSQAFLNDDHSSDFKTKSYSTSINSLLEETNNFDNSLPKFTIFSNVLFDAEYESESNDDQSCSDEDVLEKIISKPLYVKAILTMVMNVRNESRLSMSVKIRLTISFVINELASFVGTELMLVTIAQHKFLLSKLCQVFHNNILVVKILGLLINLKNKLEEKKLEEERAAKAQNWKLPICYDDDDEEERSDSLDDNIISGLPPFSAITPNEPVLSTEEPDNSLSMRDEHLDTIPATESDEFIKSSVEDLIPIPSESEGGIDDDILREKLLNVNYIFAKIEASNDNPILFYDPIISGTPLTLTSSGESDFFLEVDAFLAVEDEPTSSQFPKSYLDLEGDVLLLEAFLNDDHSSDFKTKSYSTSINSLLEETNNFDNSLPKFTIFSNVLFDAEYESESNDDQSCSDEDVLEKIISKPLFEE
nr:hypothetical protein [Tanacetum cinerariifolium]